MKPHIRKLSKAWNDKGVNPKYHDEQKFHLMAHWPTLYFAISEALAAEELEEQETHSDQQEP